MNWEKFKKSYERDILSLVKKSFPEIKDNNMGINWDAMKFEIENIPPDFIYQAKHIIDKINSSLSMVKKPN